MDKTERYNRQVILPEIGAEGQKKLAAARVLVIGAGGLGCPVLQYLAAAGVGTLGIVDHDTIDISNLQRQVLYDTADQGKQKAVAAREKIQRLNPDIVIHTHAEKLTENNILGLFSGYDIIVDSTDNFATKYLINDAAVKTAKPVVYGAIQGFEGQISVFDSTRGPCYRCLYPQPPQEAVASCAENGVIGALAGIAGTVQAMEAIKLIVDHQLFQSLVGKLWMIDTRMMETRILNIARQKECPVCSKPPVEIALQNYSPVCSATMVTEIDCKDVTPDDAVIIDVRELPEWGEGHIDGAHHVPLTVLQKNINVFTQPGDGKICVLYCQKGGRSRKAAEQLLNAGFKNVYSLRGGFEAWKNTRSRG